MPFRTHTPSLPLLLILVAFASWTFDCVADGPFLVSVSELHQNPEKRSGQQISVRGFLACEINLQIYPTKEDAKIETHTAVIVGDPSEDGYVSEYCCNMYAKIEGTFRYTDLYELIIRPVESVTELIPKELGLPEQKVCWSRTN